MEDLKLTQLKSKDIPKVREQILEEQKGRCALCGDIITDQTGVSLDHQHKTKSAVAGVEGGGLVRGVLCRRCNVMEGKIWNNSKRYGIHDNLSEWLRKLADYLDKENYPLIHPSEAPSEPKLKKQSYNALKKVYNKKAKFPDYPKTQKISKKLTELFSFYKIEPEFYKL